LQYTTVHSSGDRRQGERQEGASPGLGEEILRTSLQERVGPAPTVGPTTLRASTTSSIITINSPAGPTV